MDAALLLVALLLVLYLGALFERRAEARFRASHAAPGLRLEVAPGRRQHLLCMGERREGLPTVVFEAGHGAWSSCWQKVMPEIARFTRVCARDRSGYGWSDPDPTGITAVSMVDDLRALLDGAGERGPYLLVGHSMGASVARLFASRYPRDVAGMVWVDSVHEDLTAFVPVGRWLFPVIAVLSGFGALLARFGLLRFSGLADLIARYPSLQHAEDRQVLVEQVADPVYLQTLSLETWVLGDGDGWNGTRADFGRLPVTSLEALYTMPPAPLRFRAGWRAMHDALAAGCENIRRVPVQGGHVIMDEHPELVIEAVLAQLTSNDSAGGTRISSPAAPRDR